ncbi:MAG: hypothetical protein ACREB3_00155, partial [Burkholderiales bacterium]
SNPVYFTSSEDNTVGDNVNSTGISIGFSGCCGSYNEAGIPAMALYKFGLTIVGYADLNPTSATGGLDGLGYVVLLGV